MRRPGDRQGGVRGQRLVADPALIEIRRWDPCRASVMMARKPMAGLCAPAMPENSALPLWFRVWRQRQGDHRGAGQIAARREFGTLRLMRAMCSIG